jgi:hypothetical protein
MVAVTFLFGAVAIAKANPQPAHLAHDLTVGANNDVSLKSGAAVQVMKQSGATMVIMVPLDDGSQGIFQVEAAAVQLDSVETPPSAPAAPTQASGTNATAAAPLPALAAAPVATPTPAETPAVALVPPAQTHELAEDQATRVKVCWPEKSKLPAPYEKLDDVNAGSYSYRIYLPPGYYEHADYHYPALFIMSPDGNASMGGIKERAKEEGWIVVMFDQAKNGDWGPIYGDMLATHEDIVRRGIRIQEGLKFATGFSGGARGTSMLTQFCPGFDGELLQGAGFAFSNENGYNIAGIPKDHFYAVFMSMGMKDSNFVEIKRMKDALGGVPFRSVTFQGGHQGAPQPVFSEGIDWLVAQALSQGNIDDGLRETGRRLFSAMAQRWEAETDEAKKDQQAKVLATAGENLNFSPLSVEAAELKKMESGPEPE